MVSVRSSFLGAPIRIDVTVEGLTRMLVDGDSGALRVNSRCVNLRHSGSDTLVRGIRVRGGLSVFRCTVFRYCFVFACSCRVLFVAIFGAAHVGRHCRCLECRLFGTSLSRRCANLGKIVCIDWCVGSLGLFRIVAYFILLAYVEIGKLVLHR